MQLRVAFHPSKSRKGLRVLQADGASGWRLHGLIADGADGREMSGHFGGSEVKMCSKVTVERTRCGLDRVDPEAQREGAVRRRALIGRTAPHRVRAAIHCRPLPAPPHMATKSSSLPANSADSSSSWLPWVHSDRPCASRLRALPRVRSSCSNPLACHPVVCLHATSAAAAPRPSPGLGLHVPPFAQSHRKQPCAKRGAQGLTRADAQLTATPPPCGPSPLSPE